jgi:hypothetical protein
VNSPISACGASCQITSNLKKVYDLKFVFGLHLATLNDGGDSVTLNVTGGIKSCQKARSRVDQL